MAKTLLSIQDLRWRALAEMRKQPGARAFRASQSIENTHGTHFLHRMPCQGNPERLFAGLAETKRLATLSVPIPDIVQRS